MDRTKVSKTHPSASTLSELFVERARQCPDSVAVVDAGSGESLTYGELAHRSGVLAGVLRGLGVGPERLVGVCLPRTLDMVVAVLGVLRAGGGYVPLDPAFPQERLSLMVGDSAADVVVTQRSLVGLLPVGVRMVCVDEGVDWSGDSAVADVRADPDGVAYVIYTSGSTGRPKGVAVTHQNVLRLFDTTRQLFALSDGDVWAMFHSFAFDFSVWEMWAPLLHGGRLVILPHEMTREPEAVYDALRDQRVTVLNQTPSAFRQIIPVAVARPDMLVDLRLVVFGGEALQPATLQPWINRYGDQRPQLVNMYGITETTVHVTHRTVITADLGARSVIGSALPDLRVRLLDERLNPVSDGAAGEIFVSGPGVARGYLGQPGLTARRFLPDPWSDVPGGRMYRSGDQARAASGGDLEYLGRLDGQVKVRGFRIELGEVEGALDAHPGVQQSVVVAQSGEDGNTRLISYVVPREATDTPIINLREWLASRLPAHMIPAIIVRLGRIPLTANGKVDRSKLPTPCASRDHLPSTYAPPQDPVQQILVRVWEQTLGVESVGIWDNFFQLGGDSILSMQVVTRAREFGVSLSARDFFRHATVAELAQAALADRGPLPDPAPVRGRVRLSPVQHWLFQRTAAPPHHYNQSQMVVWNHPLNEQALTGAVSAVISHHDALRARFRRDEGGEWTQSIDLPGRPVWIETVRLRPGEDVDTAVANVQSGLDIEEAPLVRVVVIKGASFRPRVLLVVHHLVVDSVSWRVLFEDLRLAYEQAVDGRDIQLPLRSSSVRDWTDRLTAWAAGQLAEEQASYWIGLADGASGELCPARDTTVGRVGDSRSFTAVLDRNSTEKLVRRAATNQVRVDAVLLAALLRAAGRSKLLVDMESHGRELPWNDLELSRTVGWFTSIYPVHLRMPAESTELAAVRQIGDQVQEAGSGGAGYGVLRYLTPDPTLSERLRALPARQVLFNYLGRYAESVENELFTPVDKVDHNVGPDLPRSHQLDVVAYIQHSQLFIEWTFMPGIPDDQLVRRIAAKQIENVQSITEALPASGGPVSGMAVADVDTDALASLLAQFKIGGVK
ncbi:amino acid adenylation domain-containing protein [Streptomyces sp. NPDC051218]|uniref:amino acid adenylation domain-containing protein n=1 Tax=Streptomyces sp. NPDC051218 TaxID=3365645 RepID=UPI0037941F36